jgi:hypothetical protein
LRIFFLNIFDNVFFFSSNSNTLQIEPSFLTQVPRTDVADAVAEWAPQYWVDALGGSIKFLEGSVHKILDFQTMEYGYATDFG